jgi:hypothetical protein
VDPIIGSPTSALVLVAANGHPIADIFW